MIMSQRVKEQKEEWSGNRSESEQLVQRQTVWRFQATKRSQKWLVRCEGGVWSGILAGQSQRLPGPPQSPSTGPLCPIPPEAWPRDRLRYWGQGRVSNKVTRASSFSFSPEGA